MPLALLVALGGCAARRISTSTLPAVSPPAAAAEEEAAVDDEPASCWVLAEEPGLALGGSIVEVCQDVRRYGAYSMLGGQDEVSWRIADAADPSLPSRGLASLVSDAHIMTRGWTWGCSSAGEDGEPEVTCERWYFDVEARCEVILFDVPGDTVEVRCESSHSSSEGNSQDYPPWAVRFSAREGSLDAHSEADARIEGLDPAEAPSEAPP